MGVLVVLDVLRLPPLGPVTVRALDAAVLGGGVDNGVGGGAVDVDQPGPGVGAVLQGAHPAGLHRLLQRLLRDHAVAVVRVARAVAVAVARDDLEGLAVDDDGRLGLADEVGGDLAASRQGAVDVVPLLNGVVEGAGQVLGVDDGGAVAERDGRVVPLDELEVNAARPAQPLTEVDGQGLPGLGVVGIPISVDADLLPRLGLLGLGDDIGDVHRLLVVGLGRGHGHRGPAQGRGETGGGEHTNHTPRQGSRGRPAGRCSC